MGFINLTDKTINAKLVYYGVGVGGKTTSLQAVHGVICPRNETNLVSIKTEQDATLMFDFLPINLGQVEGFKIRIQGYTVPGQPKYKRMRKHVLQGADAVVFVVDSQASRVEENIEALESLRENLRANGIDPETIPIVLQHNKRDLGDVLPEEELNRLFQWRDDIASFPSVATENQGVFETFVHTMGMLIHAKIGHYGLDRRGVEASAVAEGVRAKLWDIYDQYRGMIATEPDRMIELTVPESAEADEPNSSRSDIFADDDLKIDLGADEFGAHESGEVSEPIEDAGLLEQTIDSNVQLAEQFGALDEYRNLLERKNTELVHIAQNTVHDLNRPLAAISLLLSSMEKGYLGDLNQSMRAGVENGIEAVAMMSRLIGDLIDSSRLDFQGVEFEFGSVDISKVIEDVLGTLRYEIEENSIRMQVESLPSILGDEWMLKRLFLNLLGNAVLYSDPGVDSVIRVHSYEEEDRSVFVIEDNGIGIPEQDLPRLFRRFERGSNTAGVSGSGLGLHIVKEVVAGHGGTVWVESTEGVGSRFMVGIPRQPVQAPHSSVSETAEIADL